MKFGKVKFFVRVRVWVMVRLLVGVRGRVLLCPSEPSRERVKVSHVIVECRVINHHPRFQCHKRNSLDQYFIQYYNRILR